MHQCQLLNSWFCRTLVLGCALITAICTPVSVLASPENDYEYKLYKVGSIRSWDNVDSLFSEYVARAYRDYFVTQTRFVYKELTKEDQVLASSKVPYSKLIEDSEILAQLARTAKVDSLLRTRIAKNGHQYRFSIEWVHLPKLDIVAEESFTLEEGDEGLKSIDESLKSAVGRLVAKLPFVGQVTGREGSVITIDLGKQTVKPREAVVLASIDDVKTHPLLNTVVDWRLSRTGLAIVESVEQNLAFARIQSEEDGREVARLQKIVQILPAPAEERTPVIENTKAAETAATEARVADGTFVPQIGYIAGGASLGYYSREYGMGSITRSGTGVPTIGFSGEGRAWINSEFFGDLGFGYATWSYSQIDPAGASSQLSGLSGDLFEFKIAAGYSYLITNQLYGPKVWGKAGIHSFRYNIPVVDQEGTGLSSFSSLYVAIGGDLPVRDRISITGELNFGLFRGAKLVGFGGGDSGSVSDVHFSFGGLYRWNQRWTLKASLDFRSHGASGADDSTFSQRIISISPSLLYYF